MSDGDVPPKQAVWMGLAFIVLGSVPVLGAIGVLPFEDESFHVPRWLAALIASCFPAAGVWMLTDGLSRLFGPQWPLAKPLASLGVWCLGFTVVSFIVGLAIFFTWELISPFPGASQGVEIMGISFPPDSLVGRVLGRIGAAIGALIIDGIVLLVAWAFIKGLFAPKKGDAAARRAR